jgi:hypothetical protein
LCEINRKDGKNVGERNEAMVKIAEKICDRSCGVEG